MLNIDEIQNGIVIDHIKAGTAVGLMDLLGIKSNRTASVAPDPERPVPQVPHRPQGHHQGGGGFLLAEPGRAGLPGPQHHRHHHPGRQAGEEGKTPAAPPSGQHRPVPQSPLHLHHRGGSATRSLS